VQRPRFDDYEKVRCVTAGSVKARIAGKLAAVHGRFKNDDGIWVYSVWIYDESSTYDCLESELESTGEFEEEGALIEIMTGALSEEDPEFGTFLDRLGRAVVAGEFAVAYAMLAGWLQKSMTLDDFQSQIVEQCREIADIWDLSQTASPERFEVSQGDMSLDQLEQDSMDLPQEVTYDNFRGWACIQFQPDGEEDPEFGYFDWWLLVVEVDGELRVGYFQIEDPD
jgi:hypothetical protein